MTQEEYLQKQIGAMVITIAGLQSKLDAFTQTNNELLADNIRLKAEIDKMKENV